jgi:hypothetical protein
MICGKPITFMKPSVRWPDVLVPDSVPCSRDGDHPGMCSTIPDSGAGYTRRVTHVHVFYEDDSWFLDGRDEHDNFTEACWSYDTWDEAMAQVPEFIRALTEDYSVTIDWRKRCTAMCAGGGYAFICKDWAGHDGHHRGRALSLAETPVATGLTSDVQGVVIL